MKFNLKGAPFSIILITMLCLSLPLSAQPGFEEDVDDEEEIDPPPAAIIDGFIALGISAGVIYGLKKINK